MSRFRLILCTTFAATALGLFGGSDVVAQSTWEFDPYETEIWLVAGDSPLVSAALVEELRGELQAHAHTAFGAAWRTTIGPPPVALAADIALPDWELPFARLKEHAAGTLRRERVRPGPPPADGAAVKPDIIELDKLFTVVVNADERGYVIVARQFDNRTRRWSPAEERATAQRDGLGAVAWEAIQSVFTPNVRIEKVVETTVTARMRAGGLIVDPETNPAGFRPGEALAAVVRRNDRAGEPLKGAGIQMAPWTALLVTERENSLLRCELHSGVRFAIPSRGGPRTERLAFRATPRYPATDLVLEARTKDSQPLEGFDVFSRLPGAETNDLIGRTDWRGMLPIPVSNKSPVQVLYIRSGGKVMAKLPIIAGFEPSAAIRLPDDGRRLHAEGLVAAMQSRVTDLVARREIHAARIRSRIKAAKLDEARKLLEELRGFETRADLLKELDDYVATVKSPDRSTQFRIDKLFADVRKLLAKFLDPQLPVRLGEEIAQAANVPPPAPEPPQEPQPVEPAPRD